MHMYHVCIHTIFTVKYSGLSASSKLKSCNRKICTIKHSPILEVFGFRVIHVSGKGCSIISLVSVYTVCTPTHVHACINIYIYRLKVWDNSYRQKNIHVYLYCNQTVHVICTCTHNKGKLSLPWRALATTLPTEHLYVCQLQNDSHPHTTQWLPAILKKVRLNISMCLAYFINSDTSVV